MDINNIRPENLCDICKGTGTEESSHGREYRCPWCENGIVRILRNSKKFKPEEVRPRGVFKNA